MGVHESWQSHDLGSLFLNRENIVYILTIIKQDHRYRSSFVVDRQHNSET